MIRTVTALLVDSEGEKKRQLKAIMKLCHIYGDIILARDYNDAVEKIKEASSKPDMMILAAEGAPPEISKFLEQLRSSPEGRFMLFILLLRTESRLTHERALLLGADGTLQEPFSAEDVQKTTEEAIAQLEKLRIEKYKDAIQLVVRGAIGLIDRIAQMLRLREGPGELLMELRSKCQPLREIDSGLTEYYFERAIEAFMNVEPPPEVMVVPEGATLREKMAIRRKLQKAHEIRTSMEEDRPTIICSGEVDSPAAAEALARAFKKLVDQGAKHVQLDLFEAKNPGSPFVRLVLTYMTQLKKKGISVAVQGDDGLIKSAIQKIKKMKLQQQAPPEGAD